MNRIPHPFWVIVQKEVSDHVRSWRFNVLLFLILLTCFGSLYTAITTLVDETAKASDADDPYFFLKLFTLSDGSLPPFHVFVGFLGPLLGIGLGFDAINSEQNSGTLSRIMAQPIHRDYVINAKFTAAFLVVSILFFALGFLVMGFGMVIVGIPPTAEEFLRIVFFLLLSVLYVAFWLNLSVFLSIRFRQAATSALTAIAIWLFFTVFYQLIVHFVARAMMPADAASPQQLIGYQQFILNLMRVVPSQLYTDATTTLLMPSIRSLGPLTMEQTYGAIPSPLPLGQSLLIVWPQLTGLIAGTVVCFVLSYSAFMRKEIRSR
ncbi:ABC transporter permease [Parapedobacter koreensis]|uniref:ABC-2 type transport system permease protein n=1 Tax=Parapedobacter koreensis TaxID=332977 RepID=A0A1H7LXU7_9SPHI|nr:ABC transporter permease [Parapedobacter koreensis]SEL03578.1 ABC-2 type transport system permease protein [Parapedobacter koreensis]